MRIPPSATPIPQKADKKKALQQPGRYSNPFTSVPTLGPILLSLPNAAGTFSHGGETGAGGSPFILFLLWVSRPAPYLTAELAVHSEWRAGKRRQKWAFQEEIGSSAEAGRDWGPWANETSVPTQTSAQLPWNTVDTLQPRPPDGPSL